MIIKSKKDENKIIEVSLEEWNKMKKLQLHRYWRIVSSRDIEPAGEAARPADVVNFMNSEPKVQKIYDEEKELKYIPTTATEDDYKSYLKSSLIKDAESRGIDISDNPTKAELAKRLIEDDNK